MAATFPEWRRLHDLLAHIKSTGVERLEAEEIVEFGKLYRRAAADLAYQRTHEAEPARIAFLNDLLGECYPYVYAAPRRPLPSVITFFTTEFPRAVRAQALWILLAVALSLVPALICFAITWHDRAIADQVLPGEFMATMESIAARHHAPKDWLPLMERTPAAAMIMTNNIRVSILAFAGGMTAGLLTIYLMVYNGIMIGVLGAAVGLDGPATALNFWAFVAPHGVLELTAIFIAGGAGLLMGYAIVNPGLLPRRVALRRAALEALKLMLGVAAILVVAGCIEGFFSPLPNVAEHTKLAVAAAEGFVFFSYLAFAGRGSAIPAGQAPRAVYTSLPPV